MRRAAALLFTAFALSTPLGAAPPAAGNNPMEDPYIWLEDVHGEKPLAWVKAENAKALGHLKANPVYQKNYDFILNVLDAKDRIPVANLERGHAYNFWQDGEHRKGIWRRTTVADYQNAAPSWEVLIDLDKLATDEKENWVWKGADCSASGKRCLVRLSRGGGDAVVVREFDMQTKSFVKDGFYLKEAKSDVAIVTDDIVLFGTDFGPGSMTTSGYPRIVKEWHRGQKIEDAKTILEAKPDDMALQSVVYQSPLVGMPVIVRAVSFFEAEYYVRGAKHHWFKMPVPLSAELHGFHAGQALFTLRQDWTVKPGETLKQGSLIAIDDSTVGEGQLGTIKVLYTPGPRAAIEKVNAGGTAVYVSVLNNVIGEVHVFRWSKEAWSSKKLPLPDGGTVSIASVNDYGQDVLLAYQSFLKPSTLYYDNGQDLPKDIKALPARFDSTNMETVQFEATSKDGTKIPYFVLRQKGLKGPVPTILNGYGGFEISETPFYSANYGRLWVARGGVYVLANIRGGGEFGPAWHEAALKTNRQRAYDDFAAIAADLIARKITTAKELGIVGGSNGGLLVSTVMTQHPELLGAVVCQVPLIDMIRYTQIGAGASWIGEYGDPADPEMAAYIKTYSPYQNVKKDGKYPPIFFVTATSDDRVTPVHARKMAARMMEQGHEVLFYENTDGGHAAAADHKQGAELWGLTFVYLAEKLGLKNAD